MLEPPAVQDGLIVACLDAEYGLPTAELTFLPIGADPDTAVYRVRAAGGAAYFLKLRRGRFPETTITIPRWLAEAGMPHLIAPLPTRATGAAWARFGDFAAMLFPFVTGRSGWDVALTPEQWEALGASLRALHRATPPEALLRGVPREDYTPFWREQARGFLQRAAEERFAEPLAADLARLLREQHDTILWMLTRAEELATDLTRRPRPFRLCHGDIHAGNVMIDDEGRLYVVDWDTLIVAPKERDLMFIGAGIGGIWDSQDEADWFYRGYGQAEIDAEALVYYRYERIVQDVAVGCRIVLNSDEGGENRAAEYRQLSSQFTPGSVAAIARATDERLLAP